VKSQTKRKDEVEAFEVLDIDSDSDDSSPSVSPR